MTFGDLKTRRLLTLEVIIVSSQKVRVHAVAHRGAFIRSYVNYGISTFPKFIANLLVMQLKTAEIIILVG